MGQRAGWKRAEIAFPEAACNLATKPGAGLQIKVSRRRTAEHPKETAPPQNISRFLNPGPGSRARRSRSTGEYLAGEVDADQDWRTLEYRLI
jgi:hypothetical protein